jgi:hypothetical protein
MEHLMPGVMLVVGIACHILKKVVERRQADISFQLKDYLIGYPYQTAVSVLMAVGGYVGLHAMGDLTMSSAFLAGVTANSLAGAAPGKR